MEVNQQEYQIFLVCKSGKETHVQDITENKLIKKINIRELQK